MKRKIYFVLIIICMLPMMAFAGTDGEKFASLTGDIYTNHSTEAVIDEAPTVDNIFEVEKTTRITGIWTYHWNVGEYDGNGNIKLVNVDTNAEYGPWDVVTENGSGRDDVDWFIFPNVVIPAGSYKIVDSQNDTWSYTSDTGKKGISKVKGFSVERIGDVEIDGTKLKPVVGNAPYNITSDVTNEKYRVAYQHWFLDTDTQFLDGKHYLYNLTLEPKDGYYFDEEDKVTVNDIVWNNPDSIYNGSEDFFYKETLGFRGVTWVYSNEYKFNKGANLETSDINKFVFEIDADFSKFSGDVYVGISKVPSTMFTAESGSTIITLNPEYVKSFTIGEIKFLRVVFNDGVAMTNFTRLSNSVPEEEPISDETVEPEDTPEVPEVIEETPEIIVEETPVNNPKTSDNIVLYILLGLISLSGLTSTIIYKKKKFN